MNPRKTEIESLHKFFVQWFKAEIPQTNENFNTHFVQTISESSPPFTLVSPSGVKSSYKDLITDLYNAYACRKGDDTYTIWIDNVQEQTLGNGLYLMEYEEHQCVSKKHTKRLSTALLRERCISGDITKLEWVRVHETWMTE